ncbi:MAG: hypothetical protein WC222_10145 [Parachlamydiales bacterium]|jgi:hypothetical protein
MTYKFITLALLLVTITTLTSCYRMPTDQDYCVLPTTNNRNVTRERAQQSPMPGISM